jgi:peptidyl-prolyl cis-trans isomerase C
MCNSRIVIKSLMILLLGLFLVACDAEEPAPTEISNTPTIQIPTATFTPFPPTPTPVPLAAKVNRQEITMDEFESELQRFMTSQELEQVNTNDIVELIVLQELIDRLLLAESAWQNGFVVNDEALQTRLDLLVEEVGSQEEMDNWLLKHGYTESSFLESLRVAMAAAWMRDQVLLAVPNTAEQVHARQIFTNDPEVADQIYNQLQAGADFTTLAAEFDPLFQGDLGWFPRGYLLEPDLEDAAFELKPGEFSQVFQTRLGYHILQVIDRELDRVIEPDAYVTIQKQVLRDWVESRREESDIQIFLPVPQE